ncbi:putative glycerophosphocholine phosphodiesterase GPCPD1 homolog 2 [Oppia nitens]|uniref:putative glycerophosphocholine phosphodiesterase GPCPD1 homolog 2 n=1 Tax=Oppia nitens TaxID=1686743 RepID=UPI0023DBF22E|nr:putative glycerophosphocholine phosphodiesterase GPCPD1 homolog 2 [Oppia nitens]
MIATEMTTQMDTTTTTTIGNRIEENIINIIKTDKCLDSDLFIKRNEIQIHLKLYNSIDITSRSLKSSAVRLRVSMYQMLPKDAEASNDGSNFGLQLTPIELSVQNDKESLFAPQEPFGRLYSPKEYLIYRTKFTEMDEVAFTIELLTDDSDPKRIAFCNLFASHLKDTNGVISMSFNTENGKIVAQLHFEYLIMNPIKCTEDFHEKVSVESWLTHAKGYDVGHRGAGIARRTDRIENILENTIASFNFASLHGADMVELDVQLSKDKIPIVYHDFNVNIIMKNKRTKLDSGRPSTEVHTMAIKDLTFSQLQSLQSMPVIKENKVYYDFGDEDQSEEHLPFASLQKVLEMVDPKCGANVEIKYPQEKVCGQWEADKTFDLNEYVDIILSIVFEFGGARNIMFSSFHPDICALLKYKQTRYPVLFLTQGLTAKWPPFKDYRGSSIEMAAYFAQCVGLEGVNVHAEDIIKDRSLIGFVKSKNLILFCWGDDLNDTKLISELKGQGVDGVIYDRIDILCAKGFSNSK